MVLCYLLLMYLPKQMRKGKGLTILVILRKSQRGYHSQISTSLIPKAKAIFYQEPVYMIPPTRGWDIFIPPRPVSRLGGIACLYGQNTLPG
jgi:hypothetical protein